MLVAGNSQRGATMVEFTISILFVTSIIVFVLDAGVVLTQVSSLNHSTATVVRALSTELGRAWNNDTIAGLPWSGSCDSYIRSQGAAIVTTPGHSFSDSTAPVYFGGTLDENRALVVENESPYAILRIVGRSSAACIFCKIFPAFVVTSEKSILVEYNERKCSDYTS